LNRLEEQMPTYPQPRPRVDASTRANRYLLTFVSERGCDGDIYRYAWPAYRAVWLENDLFAIEARLV